MAIKNSTTTLLFLLFLFSVLLGALVQPGFGATHPSSNLLPLKYEIESQVPNLQELRRWRVKSARRLMIGSTAPTCTYNECRGCRFKCSAKQVPVDITDPMNTAYYYRCLCHR